jgi:hypothetical protein
VYVAGGTVIAFKSEFSSNQAIGGAGGVGGSGGIGGKKHLGGIGGEGGHAGAAAGGGLYLAQGTVALTASTLGDNAAVGGAGGHGGSGGLGGGIAAVTTLGLGTIIGGGGFADPLATGAAAAAGASQEGGPGGRGGLGASGAGGGIYVAGGTLTLTSLALSGNQAIGGAGGKGGIGGIGADNPAAGTGLIPVGERGGTGGHGGNAGSGYGGGLYAAAGTITIVDSTLSTNNGQGGQGGAGGTGGSGYIAAVFGGGGGTIITTGGGIPSLTKLPPGGATAANTGGPGGDGANGGLGQGGGLYVSGGAITLESDTVAGNTAQIGPAGPGALGGHAGTGKLTGGAGVAGSPGNANGGGLYVNGGSVTLDNSTVADNDTASTGAGGGADIVQGTVALQSTIVALNTRGTGTGATASDIAGTVASTSSYDLIGAGGSGGLTGSSNHNQLNVASPGLGTLANNGGLTQTMAPGTGSPAIRAGADPENLFADQRGYGVASGTTWDVGAYQSKASPDTTPPTATLQAANVTASNAGSLNPYTFSLTFTDNVAVSAVTLGGALVEVQASGGAPVVATMTTTTAVGSTDATGNAREFVVKFQITPPGGAWAAADNGTYNVILAGTPVTDLAGNDDPAGAVGTFSVQIATASSSAVFVGQDTTTQGNWIGPYGAQGYDVIGSSASIPSYANVTPSGETNYTWAASTTDQRGLKTANGTGRIAACWYSATSFTVDVNLTDSLTHDLELYFLDWGGNTRAEQVSIANAATGAVLNTESISSFNSGIYLKWTVSGNVLITITRTSGANAVLSGLFLDPPPAPATGPASALFIGRNTTTQGSWIGTFGAQGYDVIGGTASIPSYATVTPSGESPYTWAASTTDQRALETAGGTSRIAACWYSATSFTVDVNLTDGLTHDLELYFLDWGGNTRGEQVTITSTATGSVLNTESVSSFNAGVYLEWAITGNVLITITRTSGANAVLSGLFLDPGT